MDDLAHRVKHVLAVYLDRGRQAVKALHEGRFDEAQEILLLRNAAFHNFKAVDALAMANGCDVASDDQTLDLWSDIRKIDVELNAALAIARDATKELHDKIHIARSKIGKYRARKAVNTSFTKSA